MEYNHHKETERSKAVYEEPIIDIIFFSFRDVVSTSGFVDENQGEWDPQKYSNYPVY